MDDVTTTAANGGTGTQVLGASPAGGANAAPSGSGAGYDSIDAGASVSSSNVDTDGDGLTDQFERMAGLNPLALDSDGDGLTDGFELATSHTNPLLADSDGDGVLDGAQFAASGAGAGSGANTAGTGTAPTTTTTDGTDPVGAGAGAAGATGTGTQDSAAQRTGTQDTAAGGATGAGTGTGTDGAGTTGTTATGSGAAGTGATGTGAGGADTAPVDTDGDGLSDQYEIAHGTSPTLADSDGDGLADGLEVTLGTDPTQADTDHDGLSDGAEVRLGSDPLHAAQTGAQTGAAQTGTGAETNGQTAGTGTSGSGSAGTVPTTTDPTAGGSTMTGNPPPGPATAGAGTAAAGTGTVGTGTGMTSPVTSPQTGGTTPGMPQPPAPQPGTTVTTVTTVTSGNQTVTTVTTATAAAEGTQAPAVPDKSADDAKTAAHDPAPKSTGDSAVAHAKDINEKFLHAAEKQIGDQYVFGVEVDVNDPDPKVFDCAELTKWAAHQAGTDIPGSSFEQYLDLKQKGLLIPVEEAKHIPGALLFHFSSEPVPGGGRPDEAHVAISKGDGTTVEAADESEGVLSKNAGSRFEYAAVLPGTMPAVTGEGTATVPDTTGGDTGSGHGGLDLQHLTVDEVMHGIMMQESGGDYKAENPYETASGAYQYIDGTWDGYGGYSHASDAPPAVQDAKARSDLEAAYKRLGDWERVIAAHFAGEDGQAGPKSDWDQVPHPENHNPSIRQYVDGVEKFIAEDSGTQHKSMPTSHDGAAAEQHADGADAHDAAVHDLAGGASGGTFAIDHGAALGAVDTDGDGLTDDFERMIGSDPTQFDSDHDGLSDGYEAMAGGGGLGYADTDHDGLSDTLEAALGTNPLLADTDHDGLTDQLEVQFGSNPLAPSLGSAAPVSPTDDDAGHHADLHPGVDAGWH